MAHNNHKARRVGLYGAAALVLGGLVYGGFIYRVEPDVLTILGSADLYLRVAAILPENGKDGRPLAVREENLHRVEDAIAEVERREPGLSVSRQFSAYVAYLRKDHASALRLYGEALSARDFQEAQRPRILLDMAKLHQELKQDDQALQILAGLKVGPAIAAEAALVQACILRGRNQVAEAAASLKALASVEVEQGGVLIECAQLLAELGELPAAAELAGRAATRCDAIGLYRIARLKFEAGQVDTALTMLDQAVRADSETVQATLKRDLAVWEPVRSDPRFQDIGKLNQQPAAAPGR